MATLVQFFLELRHLLLISPEKGHQPVSLSLSGDLMPVIIYHLLCITLCNNNKTNQITAISTLQFICKLHSFMHIISIESSGAAIALSGSGPDQMWPDPPPGGGYPATSGFSRI